MYSDGLSAHLLRIGIFPKLWLYTIHRIAINEQSLAITITVTLFAITVHSVLIAHCTHLALKNSV